MFQQDDDCEKPVCKESPFGKLRNSFQPGKPQHQCPLNRQQLGQNSWSLMHTFAAYYPQNPTENQKNIMKHWLQGFKYMYPCNHCRPHFQKDYDKDPPSLQSQRQLLIWTCRQHNYVNKILGKPQFECSYDKLLNRWKTGCDTEEF